MSDPTKALKAILSDGTIAFHAIFAKAFRSLPIGVFLSQGFFWQENSKFRSEKTHRVMGGKLFFTKTAKEWFEETSLSPDQQKAVRVTLCKQGVLIEKLTDNPAKLYFHIDFETLVSEINRYLGSGVSVLEDKRNLNRFKSEPSIGNNPKQDSDKIPTSYNEESLDSFESEGERNTPTPAETSNLQSQKKENGLVAPGRENLETVKAEIPPSKKVAPKKVSPTEDDDAFSQWLPSLHAAMANNAPGSMPIPPAPNFEVTAIASPTDLPGVMLVEAAPIHHRKNGRIEIPDEAAAEILPWANGDGEQTVKKWYEQAYRQHSPKDVEAMVLRFSTVFLSSPTAATRDMMETNPLSFFKRRFSKFVADQPSFDRLNAPKEGGATRNGNGQTTYTAPKSVFKASTL